jgi:hypothetical protein
MEEIDYSILFRWFIGMNLDDEVWDATVFTKNRDRLLEADEASTLSRRVSVGTAHSCGTAGTKRGRTRRLTTSGRWV